MVLISIEELMRRVKAGEPVSFHDTLRVIDQAYRYLPCRFRNGLGPHVLVNEAGTNEGSCKIFYFARLHGLDREQTLTLFGDYYRYDVICNPEGANHGNIRRFMRDGWPGIHYEGIPLIPRETCASDIDYPGRWDGE